MQPAIDYGIGWYSMGQTDTRNAPVFFVNQWLVVLAGNAWNTPKADALSARYCYKLLIFNDFLGKYKAVIRLVIRAAFSGYISSKVAPTPA